MPAHLGERRRCERCGAEIIFLRHERTGKLAPIEVTPNRSGTFVVDWDTHAYRTFYQMKKVGQDYYENHYVACPSAQFFREGPG